MPSALLVSDESAFSHFIVILFFGTDILALGSIPMGKTAVVMLVVFDDDINQLSA